MNYIGFFATEIFILRYFLVLSTWVAPKFQKNRKIKILVWRRRYIIHLNSTVHRGVEKIFSLYRNTSFAKADRNFFKSRSELCFFFLSSYRLNWDHLTGKDNIESTRKIAKYRIIISIIFESRRNILLAEIRFADWPAN